MTFEQLCRHERLILLTYYWSKYTTQEPKE